MMTYQEWSNSKWSQDAGGKKVASYILQESYCKNILYSLLKNSQVLSSRFFRWLETKGHPWITFMRLWVELRRLLLRASQIRRRIMRRQSSILTKDENVNFINLYIQRDIIWIQRSIIQTHLLRIVVQWWRVCLITLQGWLQIWRLKPIFLLNWIHTKLLKVSLECQWQ